MSYHTNWIRGDGNCQFAAFAKGFGNGRRTHDEVRLAAVHWMRDNPGDFVPYVPILEGCSQDYSFRVYLEGMSKGGEWGDNLTLQAMCKVYKAYVLVLKVGQKGDMVWMQVGDIAKSQSVFWLYLNNHHYENLVDRTQVG